METNQIKLDANQYAQAWASMMVTIWKDKILLHRLSAGELFNSFSSQVFIQANGDITKITHCFRLYGRMVDMGVGSGTNKSEADTPGHRHSKKWYNKSYFLSTKRLSEKRAELYGEEFAAMISDTLNF
jgi:hypothetical protein